MVHLGAHAVFCRLHGPCPGGIRRRYGSEAHDGAADARRPDGSTIRDSAARARDSAALARDSAALPGTGFVARRLHRSPTRMEDQMYDDQSKNGARERAPQTTTTDSGIPAASDEHSLTVGPDGPIVLHDHYVVQKMQAFNRERVPERVVHAKGGGAFGYFEVSADVSEWTRAAFLAKVGKRTPVLARFSTVAGEQGYADTDRDPRRFALKFYTEEGNYDLVGNNTPVFFV